jgi:hypothetical protein
MQIIGNGKETAAGPSGWSTGAVYADPVAAPWGAARRSANHGNARRARRQRGAPADAAARRARKSALVAARASA